MVCSKQKYDKKTATTILNARKSSGKKWCKEKRVYFCSECKAHHLTSEEEYDERIYIQEEQLVFKDKWKELMK